MVDPLPRQEDERDERARGDMQHRREDHAAQHVRHAVELEPTNLDAWRYLAYSYMRGFDHESERDVEIGQLGHRRRP